MTARTIKSLSDDSVISTENYSYDAAGNLTAAPDTTFSYDTNNRLTQYNGGAVSYDLDGNMLSAVLSGTESTTFTYDSANRLISAGGHTYTYNAEDVRIRNLCAGEDTKYTYNTNCKLSKLLWKDTNGTVTKYVYGRGLIGEEISNAFKTYHFDCRGSTVALTNANGVITDTFAYDTYGKLISRTGTSNVIFLYNGRDGVVTDNNGLIYMRARYYSPDMRRFINADIVAGAISEAVTLNRFAYANGNPVNYIDPFGLAAWPNLLKVGIGAVVIGGLAVATAVVTAPAAMVVCGAALTGSIISGTAGAISGYIDNGWDGAATGFMTGSISGGVFGVVAASKLGPVAVAAIGVGIDVGEHILEEHVNGTPKDITPGSIFYEAVSSVLFSFIDIFPGRIRGGGAKGGWFHKSGDLYDERKLFEKTMEKEQRRILKEESEKYARKSMERAVKDFSDASFMRLSDYFFESVWDSLIDYLYEKKSKDWGIEEFIINYVNDLVYSKDNTDNYRK